jgi:hypothetical protein
MSGMWIAVGLAIVYFAHTYFFWRKGHKFEKPPEEEKDSEEEHHNVYRSSGHTTITRFPHLVGR